VINWVGPLAEKGGGALCFTAAAIYRVDAAAPRISYLQPGEMLHYHCRQYRQLPIGSPEGRSAQEDPSTPRRPASGGGLRKGANRGEFLWVPHRKFLHVFSHWPIIEQGAAHHRHVGTRVKNLSYVLGLDSAVYSKQTGWI